MIFSLAFPGQLCSDISCTKISRRIGGAAFETAAGLTDTSSDSVEASIANKASEDSDSNMKESSDKKSSGFESDGKRTADLVSDDNSDSRADTNNTDNIDVANSVSDTSNASSARDVGNADNVGNVDDNNGIGDDSIGLGPFAASAMETIQNISPATQKACKYHFTLLRTNGADWQIPCVVRYVIKVEDYFSSSSENTNDQFVAASDPF